MKIAALAVSGAAAGLTIRYYYKWDWILLYRLNVMATLLTRTLRGVSMPFICFSVVRGVDNFPPLNRRNIVRLLYGVVTTLMSMTLGLCLVHLLIPGLDISDAPPFFRETAFAELIMSLVSGNPLRLQYHTYRDTAVPALHSMNPEKQFLDWPNHLTLILLSFVIGCIIRAPSEPDFTVALHEGSKIILRRKFNFLYVAAISMSMVYMYNVSLDDVLKLVIFLGVVLLGLVIQGCMLLPLFYLVVVRKNPLSLMKGLICTMKKDLLFSFFPSAEMINTGTAAELMNGTALYGAAVVLFINKLNGYHVEMPQLTNMLNLILQNSGFYMRHSFGLHLQNQVEMTVNIWMGVHVAYTPVHDRQHSLMVLITCCQGRDGIPYTGPLTTWFILSILNLPLSAVGLLLVPEVLLRLPIWLLNRLSALITDEVADRWAPDSDDPQEIELESINLSIRNNSGNDEAAL